MSVPEISREHTSQFLHSSSHFELKAPIASFYRARGCSLKDQLLAETILLDKKRNDLLSEAVSIIDDDQLLSLKLHFSVYRWVCVILTCWYEQTPGVD
jgi:hypothetical protein